MLVFFRFRSTFRVLFLFPVLVFPFPMCSFWVLPFRYIFFYFTPVPVFPLPMWIPYHNNTRLGVTPVFQIILACYYSTSVSFCAFRIVLDFVSNLCYKCISFCRLMLPVPLRCIPFHSMAFHSVAIIIADSLSFMDLFFRFLSPAPFHPRF